MFQSDLYRETTDRILQLGVRRTEFARIAQLLARRRCATPARWPRTGTPGSRPYPAPTDARRVLLATLGRDSLPIGHRCCRQRSPCTLVAGPFGGSAGDRR